jgi:hypothetical protein
VSGTQALLIGSGALVGLGAFLLLRAVLVVEQPRLADALARLDGRAAPVPVGPMPEGGDRWARATGRAGAWAAARLPAAGRRAPSQALALIGWTPEGYAARKVGLAAFGAVFVPLLTAVLGVTGVRLPVVVPVAGSLALAGVLFVVVDLVVRDQAAEARGQMRRALSSYLDLVSLRRDASEGPTIALERAAALGEGWVAIRRGTACAGWPPTLASVSWPTSPTSPRSPPSRARRSRRHCGPARGHCGCSCWPRRRRRPTPPARSSPPPSRCCRSPSCCCSSIPPWPA